MRRSWRQRTGRRAAAWVGAALIATTCASELGQAQTKADEPQLEAIDPDVLVTPSGGLDGAFAYHYNPLAGTSPPGQAALRGFWQSGYDAARGENYFFSGGAVALNGDLSRDGFLLRVYGSRVGYDLKPGHGRGYQTELMLGYRLSHAKADSTVYVGADYQNYRLDPDDPAAEVRGTEWGFKVAADLETLRDEAPVYYALVGEYSTAFQTYWARGRVGLTHNGATFGPEAVALGDVSFDAQRVGGFVILDMNLLPQVTPLEVVLHAGYQFVSTNGGEAAGPGGGEGPYGGITFTLLF